MNCVWGSYEVKILKVPSPSYWACGQKGGGNVPFLGIFDYTLYQKLK